jgi:hypothetical protein
MKHTFEFRPDSIIIEVDDDDENWDDHAFIKAMKVKNELEKTGVYIEGYKLPVKHNNKKIKDDKTDYLRSLLFFSPELLEST